MEEVEVKYSKYIQQLNSSQKKVRWNTLNNFIESSGNSIKSNLNIALF